MPCVIAEIDGSKPANPGTLNAWLRNNNGYDGSNDFYEEVKKADSIVYYSHNAKASGNVAPAAGVLELHKASLKKI